MWRRKAGSGRRGVSAASGRRLDAGYREEVSDVGGLRADDAGAPEGVDGVQAREAGWTGRVLPEKGASECIGVWRSGRGAGGGKKWGWRCNSEGVRSTVFAGIS